ncbi:MAG: uroporphyrinogen-III C-methyltransferase [Clostridia bacterium]
MKIRLGTRDSKLAMIQTEMLVDCIKKYDSSIEIEIVAMKTTGDKILDKTLDKIGGKGLFVKELDDALLENKVDITVHSYKDMPMEINPNLPIIALSEREDPRDVLIKRDIDELKIIGSASQRRAIQLKKLGFEQIIPIRGNLVTRLKKLDDGGYDAIVLAAAGVKRSGEEDRIERYFSVEEIIPAACQGVIAVQGRLGENFDFLKCFHSKNSEIITKAERGFVTKLNGGCSSPIAAHAVLEKDIVKLTGMYVDENENIYIEKAEGKKENAEKIGIALAEKVLKKANKKGFVALIGAGPGELSLLTLRAKELLEKAEVVLFDRLVSDDILALIPENAKKINVGKENNHHAVPQDKINEILLEEALKNQIVIRLKGGDPFVFGRGGEELDLLAKNNVKFEIVPGITSAIAAPSFAGIPVTHRDFCSSLHILTGHQKKNESLKIDFESLVKTKGTLIFLMGVSSLKEISRGLINAGIDKNMPAALVENGTRSYQRKLVSTIENLYEKAVEEKFKSPSIIIVGKVCSLSNEYDWFSKRALYGKNVVITSSKTSNGKLKKGLSELSANIYSCPSIDIEKTDVNLEKIIEKIADYTWLVFTSKNGVEIFFNKLFSLGMDTRALGNLKIAAIGPSTSAELLKFGINPDLVPNKFHGTSLANSLIDLANEQDKILFLRAEKGNAELVEKIQNANIKFDDYKIYKTKNVEIDTKKLEELKDKEVTVCFTSASTVESFMKKNIELNKMTALCIGEQTAQMAEKYGIKYFVSEKATIESMVEKILEVAK